MPVMVVTCSNAGFDDAGYPSKPQGKLISGMRVRTNSKVTQKNGAPTQASKMLRGARGFKHHANAPVSTPKTHPMRRRMPQPPALDRPPWTASTVASQGQQVITKNIEWRNPQTNATFGRAPKRTM